VIPRILRKASPDGSKSHSSNRFTQKAGMSIRNSQILIQLSKTDLIWSVVDLLHDEPKLLSFSLD
jgi:hypothetical protein